MYFKLDFLRLQQAENVWSNMEKNQTRHLKVKVNKFQNEFMKSSFHSKCEPKIARISYIVVWHCTVLEILTTFGSYFGRNGDFINLKCQKSNADR